jgi:uncharacterized protein with ATP-grasp and redox domains
MAVRVPRIVRDTLEHNPDYPAGVRGALETLAVDIELDAHLPAPTPPAPDLAEWTAAHAEHATETWLHAEWFHAELAVYREIATRCRFWETDRDPFAPAKEEEIADDRLWSRLQSALTATGPREARLAHLLDASLWGNRVDLSYSVAAGRERRDEDLLVDDREAIVPRLATASDVHVVADNTGTELAIDLALVDAILESAARVTVHVKSQPVFVSDALVRDVWRLVDAMEARGGEARGLAAKLRAAFDAGRLRLAPDPFWSGPRFLWQAPAHVANALAAADVVILKGDANYRRVVGDAVWPQASSFADAAGYVGRAVLCVRTMKSDAVAGLPAGVAEALDAREPRWRIDGSRGLLQAAVR